MRLATGYLWLGMLALLCSGCSTFALKNRGPLDNLDLDSMKAAGYPVGPEGAQIPIPTGTDVPSVVLEVNKGKKHLERIPLPADKPMFVADLVRDAKLTDKLGRIQLVVLRPTGPNMPPVRMDVDFDTKGKNVMEGQNYSLRDGDTIIVRPDTTTAMDRFIKSINPWHSGQRD
jgi:hypothetical protein